MRIADLPQHLKPREKLQIKGIGGLKDTELLAILLRSGYQGKSALDIAERLLNRYSLAQLLILPHQTLCKLKGLGTSRAAMLLAVKGICDRLTVTQDFGNLNKPEDVLSLVQYLKSKKQEHLVAIYLDARGQLISQETITIGILNTSLIHAREVFAPAITLRAANLILVHNHPSGNPHPSTDDLDVTEKLTEVGELLDIPLIDHLIIAQDGWFSFRQQKLL